MVDDEGFLRRWSRRKQDARRDARRDARPDREPDSGTPPPSEAGALRREAGGRRDDDARRVAVAGERPGPAAAEPDRPVVPPEALPDIASLGAGSDFRAFMRPGVPPELRAQALRKLWRVKPLVGNPERLLEYDDDYTDAARVTKGLKTLYRVGRGVFTDAELAALDAGQEAPVAAEPGAGATTAGAADATAPAADGEAGDVGEEEPARRPPAAPDATG